MCVINTPPIISSTNFSSSNLVIANKNWKSLVTIFYQTACCHINNVSYKSHNTVRLLNMFSWLIKYLDLWIYYISVITVTLYFSCRTSSWLAQYTTWWPLGTGSSGWDAHRLQRKSPHISSREPHVGWRVRLVISSDFHYTKWFWDDWHDWHYITCWLIAGTTNSCQTNFFVAFLSNKTHVLWKCTFTS